MTLAAEVLQGVGGGDAPDSRAHLQIEAACEALHQAAAEGIAHAGGIDEMIMMLAPVLSFMFARRVARGRPADRTPTGNRAKR